MKKVLYTILFSILTIALVGQNFVSDNYQNFIDSDQSTVVQVHGPTFQLAAAFMSSSEDEDAEKIRETLSTLKSFQLVAMPDLSNPQAEYENGLNKIGDEFDELVMVKDKEGRFSVHIDEEDGIVYELIGLGVESDENRFLAFSLDGEIPLDMIGEIMNNVDINGSKDVVEILEKKNIEISSLKVYPNPTTVNNSITVEIPDNLVGGEGVFADINGKVVSSFGITNQTKTLNTSGLAPGYYFISLTKGGTTLKRKVNVIR